MRANGVVVVLALSLGAVVAAPAAVSAQHGMSLDAIETRDRLIADQESLLNTYRCMFGVDTQAVPGGCANGTPSQGPTQPGAFKGTPTQQDIDLRDNLIANQEALLNVYRCQHSIDTQLVPGGCSSTEDTTTDDPNALVQDISFFPSSMRRVVAANSSTPDLLAILANDLEWEVRQAVASNPSGPSDLLTLLAESHSIAVAGNPNTPPDTLAQLFNRRDWHNPRTRTSVEEALAGNSSTPPNILAGLARSCCNSLTDPPIRAAAAANPSTPPDTLAQLAKSPRPRDRRAVAGNPRTPADILTLLSNDLEWEVRQAVAANPSTPPDFLALLANDPKGLFVARAAAGNPSTPPDLLAQLANDSIWQIREAAAGNPSTPPDLLAQLANDSEVTSSNFRSLPWVRRAVAGNPSTRPDTLAQLANDSYEEVRRAVAGNPSTRPDTLAQLANDSENWVLELAAANPRTPADVVFLLEIRIVPALLLLRYQHLSQDDFNLIREEFIAYRTSREVAYILAIHPLSSRDVLQQLAESTRVEVRTIVASSPKTPEDILNALVRDNDPNVRRAATEELDRRQQ